MLNIAPGCTPFMTPSSLEGQAVLLAEDDSYGSQAFEDVLWDAGASVLLAHNAYQAEHITWRHALSSAVIDASLGSDAIARIAASLELRAVPYLLVSPTPERFVGICGPRDLLRALGKLRRFSLH